MAIYPGASVELLPQNFSPRPLRPVSVILHTTQAGHSSPRGFFENTTAAQGVESHFWLDIYGGVHQFMDTEKVADCQYDGNRYAISIESADNGTNNTAYLSGYTPAQLDGLNKLLVWISNTHGIPAVKCASYDGPGIGYHAQFQGPPGWNYNNHACPGNAKISQIPGIIATLKASLEPAPVPAPKPTPTPQPTNAPAPGSIVISGKSYPPLDVVHVVQTTQAQHAGYVSRNTYYVQTWLHTVGKYNDVIDGQWGPVTQAAFDSYRQSLGWTGSDVTGDVGLSSLTHLHDAAHGTIPVQP